jgi:hypothetical protein
VSEATVQRRGIGGKCFVAEAFDGSAGTSSPMTIHLIAAATGAILTQHCCSAPSLGYKPRSTAA